MWSHVSNKKRNVSTLNHEANDTPNRRRNALRLSCVVCICRTTLHSLGATDGFSKDSDDVIVVQGVIGGVCKGAANEGAATAMTAIQRFFIVRSSMGWARGSCV